MYRPNDFKIERGHFLAKGLVVAGLGAHAGGTRYHDSMGKYTGPMIGTSWRREIGRNTVDCSGVADYVNLGVVKELNGATRATIAGWMYRESGGSCCFGRYYGNYRFGLLWYTDGVMYATISNGSSSGYAYASVNLTGWHHVALVYNGSTSWAAHQMYIDGKYVAFTGSAGSPPAALPTSIYEVMIGRDYVTGVRDWDGRVADLLIYNRSLNVKEIRYLADPSNLMLSGMIKPIFTSQYPGIPVTAIPATPTTNKSLGIFRSPIFTSSLYKGSAS